MRRSAEWTSGCRHAELCRGAASGPAGEPLGPCTPHGAASPHFARARAGTAASRARILAIVDKMVTVWVVGARAGVACCVREQGHDNVLVAIRQPYSRPIIRPYDQRSDKRSCIQHQAVLSPRLEQPRYTQSVPDMARQAVSARATWRGRTSRVSQCALALGNMAVYRPGSRGTNQSPGRTIYIVEINDIKFRYLIYSGRYIEYTHLTSYLQGPAPSTNSFST